MKIQSMAHLNSNLLAAVDIKTTGPRPGIHNVRQICILPLDFNMMPYKGILPFYTDLKPEQVEDIDPKYVTKDKLAKAALNGIGQGVAADMLLSWFDKIGLNPDKKIQPLTCDWPWQFTFIQEWLGYYQTDIIFDKSYRDLIATACYCNDSAYHCIEQIPYPKTYFRYITGQLKVVNDSPGDAMSDCIAIAECHRRMLKKLF